MLNPSLGEVVTDGADDTYIVTPIGRAGHAVCGPYELRETGSYLVKFKLALAGAVAEGDCACALLDVCAERGRRRIASRLVASQSLSANSIEVTLAFQIDRPEELEYRVHTNGLKALKLFDPPHVQAMEPRSVTGNACVGPALMGLYDRGIRFGLVGDQVTLNLDVLDLAMSIGRSGTSVARQLAEAVAFQGDEENNLYRALVGSDVPNRSPPAPIPFTSTLCQQVHFTYDQYRYWTRALKEKPKFIRKQWEFVYIAQALYERGYLEQGRRGLVFGTGEEQLPALFASMGVEVLATDQAPEDAVSGGWIASGQHTYDLKALNKRSICTNRMFEQLVSYRSVNMNDIPAELTGLYDFCWSACALEHLGSIEAGFTFIARSLDTLKPGGAAVHTTEYNLSSNDDTFESEHCSFYRRKDIEGFIARISAQGFEVSPMDWCIGDGFAETVVDLPPYGRGEPHIRLKAGQYDTTSVGLIIRKPM